MPESVKVKVPGGYLTALPKGVGGRYPGIFVVFSADGESGGNLQSDPVACVEHEDGEIHTMAYVRWDDEPKVVVSYNHGSNGSFEAERPDRNRLVGEHVEDLADQIASELGL